MRDDMFEIIIERPRRGSRWMTHPRRARRMDAKVVAARDPDSLLAKLGMQRGAKMGRAHKGLNENLAPLRRYLEKQINRPWDKVWSDICQNLSINSTVQQHVRDHVGDFVAIHTALKDGVLYGQTRYGKQHPLRHLHYRLYVDPRTGILRKNKHFVTWQTAARLERAAAEKHRATRMREIAPNIQAHKLNDNCWWEIRLAPIPTKAVTYAYGRTNVYDAFTDVVHRAKLSNLPVDQLYGRHGVYAVGKRQLSRREIAALELPR